MWQASDNAPPIFTHIMQKHYSYPKQINIFYPDYPYVTDKKSPLYNGDRAVKDLKDHAKYYKQFYASNQILVMFGDDFKWDNA